MAGSNTPDNTRDLEDYFYRCFRPDYNLAVLKRKCYISLFGVFDIQVLFGKVVSRGYEFESGAYSEERFIRVAAPYAVGPPVQFISVEDNSLFNLHRVKWRLKELTNAVDSILEGFESGDSILLFRFNFSKISACLRELHGQIFFLPGNSNECYSVGPLCIALQAEHQPLYMGVTTESISQLVDNILRKSGEGKRNITMIIGNKNTGKSMLTRVLANSLFRKYAPLPYILDCDIGQPEMNPPGCVSLAMLNSPLLGAPMFHQRILLSDSYFYGRISLNEDFSSYLSILQKLLSCFLAGSHPSSPLLVNTIGWVEGKGVLLLDEMLKLFDPDFVFNFVTSSGPNYMIQKSGCIIEKPLVFFGDGIEKPMCKFSAPSILRNLRITTYMAHLCPFPTVKSFADATPYAVSFHDVALLVYTNESFPLNHIFAVLNCTFVALCIRNINHFDKDNRLFDDQDMPVLLNPDEIEPLRVVGFGFIKAIDLEKRTFFILTPLEISNLEEVNVLARGSNIDLPQCFFVSQGKKAIPYVVRENSSSFHIELFKGLSKVKSVFGRKRLLRMQTGRPKKRI